MRDLGRISVIYCFNEMFCAPTKDLLCMLNYSRVFNVNSLWRDDTQKKYFKFILVEKTRPFLRSKWLENFFETKSNLFFIIAQASKFFFRC